MKGRIVAFELYEILMTNLWNCMYVRMYIRMYNKASEIPKT